MSSRPLPPTLVDRARELARLRPDAVAFRWLPDGEAEGATLTFGELDRRARAVGAELAARGLAGERALLTYGSGLEFVVAFLGCLHARVTPTPLSTPRGALGLATLRGIVRHARAAAHLADAVTLAALPDLAATFGACERLVTDRLGSEGPVAWRPGPVDPEDLALLQYTSGSTGAPKGVEVTHASLVANLEMIRVAFGHDEATRFVTWLPTFHDMGLIGNVLQPFYLGVESTLMPPTAFVQKPARWLRAMSRYGATTTGAPNFAYDLCVERVRDEQLEGVDLSRWKVAYDGSEPVRARTLERFAERYRPWGFRREALYPCYGLAEATLFVTGGRHDAPPRVLAVDATELEVHRVRPARPERSARTLVGVGRPWLGLEVAVVDPVGLVRVEPGAVGEIWVRGPSVARGYRALGPGEEDPFAARLASGEGPFLRTGDLGFLEDGELYVTGRRKDVIVLAGRNVYPQDVELCVGRCHPSLRVDAAAAFAEEDGERERLVVVQEVHRSRQRELEAGGPDAEALWNELVGAVQTALGRTFGLTAARVVLIRHGAAPKTTSGKIQRRRCRALLRAGTLEELDPRRPVPNPTDRAASDRCTSPAP